MATQPRLPGEHYADAERLLDAADETPASAPLLALAHAVLSTAPRRARLVERHARRAGNGLPRHPDKGDEQREGRD